MTVKFLFKSDYKGRVFTIWGTAKQRFAHNVPVFHRRYTYEQAHAFQEYRGHTHVGWLQEKVACT